jgi:hypothetical protein
VKVGGARCDGLISVRQLHAKVERLPGRFAVSPRMPPSKKATHSTQVYFCGVILADWTRTSLGYHGWGPTNAVGETGSPARDQRLHSGSSRRFARYCKHFDFIGRSNRHVSIAIEGYTVGPRTCNHSLATVRQRRGRRDAVRFPRRRWPGMGSALASSGYAYTRARASGPDARGGFATMPSL